MPKFKHGDLFKRVLSKRVLFAIFKPRQSTTTTAPARKNRGRVVQRMANLKVEDFNPFGNGK